jgi:hypothetical protein
MPVNPENPLNPAVNPTGPDLESARRLARDLGRPAEEKNYDIPAFIRKNQRPTDQI